ncbi:DNA primase [Oenococcus oeni]|uniref:bifunctional DNA primase/polymerase n=1 Tax=Oenococcus oeni TaxID=1247 RepID=UPI00050FCBB8|nr:bifunctional DNA primase/polymerase [Oenococcus oeni]KGH55242.1 DNA primase [Oenococcus oeni S22]OIL58344.1 DNA primase [Oenococcus oeni]PDH79076.1 DNA primase [Oenococcus oeni]PDH93894.1 DNA primase [Oenococcus oeni]
MTIYRSKEEYAQRYAKAGMYVLPVANKHPIIKFADQPALTESQIHDIWEQHPNADIAVRTVDFFVVDIDKHQDNNGFKSLKEFNHNEYFSTTLTQKTAHGGAQMFYMKPKGIEVEQNIGWLKGVDVKAHINNYVVIAPSDGYQFVNHHKIVEASKELLKAIKPINSQYDIPESVRNKYHITEKSKTAELFERIAFGLGGSGMRNNNLTELIGGLLFRGVDPDAVLQLCRLTNQNSPQPLEESEFNKTYTSMLKKEMRRRNDTGTT